MGAFSEGSHNISEGLDLSPRDESFPDIPGFLGVVYRVDQNFFLNSCKMPTVIRIVFSVEKKVLFFFRWATLIPV